MVAEPWTPETWIQRRYMVDDFPFFGRPGWFYIAQMVPDLDPRRIKLGFTQDVKARLRTYRTLCPTVSVAGSWRCSPAWERDVREWITLEGCALLGGEVFVCSSIEGALGRARALFAALPPVPAWQRTAADDKIDIRRLRHRLAGVIHRAQGLTQEDKRRLSMAEDSLREPPPVA